MNTLYPRDDTPAADTLKITKQLLKEFRCNKIAIDFSQSLSTRHLVCRSDIPDDTRPIEGAVCHVDLSAEDDTLADPRIAHIQMIVSKMEQTLDRTKDWPDRGETLYWVLYYTYFSPTKIRNREQLLIKLSERGFHMCLDTYQAYLKSGIQVMDMMLWGYFPEERFRVLSTIFNQPL